MADGLIALTDTTIELPDGPATGVAVLVRDGRIQGVVADRDIPGDASRLRLGGGRLAAGFVDLQVNGGGGVLFNDDPSPGALARIAAAHRRFGTTSLLPTLISDRAEVTRAAIAAVAEARRCHVPGIAGLHLEGPHLAAARRGVHSAAALRPMDTTDLDRILTADVGVLLLTVAPEAVPLDVIGRLAAAGIVVALGHSDAAYETAKAAFAAGATGTTHLFNAMGQLGSRAPGVVGAALDTEAVWCGIIADGHHVHWANVRLAWRLKGRRLVLVTDAMPPVGASDPGYALYGEGIRVEDGRCLTADGRLAGSALDMAAAVRNCVHHVGLPVSEALALASAAPADAMGLSDRVGRIAPGLRADLILLDDALTVRRCWIGGTEMPLA